MNSITTHIKSLLICVSFILCNSLSAQINTEQVMTIGKNALYFEDYILSIQYFNQVIKVKPYMAEPYFYRSIAKLSLEDYNGAEEDASSAIARNKFITDAYQVRGIARQNLKKNKEAIEDYTEGLKQLPENKIFLRNKAAAEEAIKDYKNSEATYARLIKLYPKLDDAYVGRSQLYLALGDTVKALEDINKGIELGKNNPNAYVLRADILTKFKDDYASASKDMDEAIKLQPHFAGYFINRAFFKYKNDDYFGAMADYDYAIALEPQNTMARFNRGLLRMEVRDNLKAIEDFSAVISRDPNNMGARYNRADLYAQTGQYKKAVKDYDVVLTKVDDMPGLYYARSECKRKSGDVAGGMRDYDKSKRMIKQYKYRPNQPTESLNPEDVANAPETEEDVKNKFKTLLTLETNNDLKPQYEDKARGKIQDSNFSIEAEPLFILSYYTTDDKLRDRSNYVRELTDLNDTKALPATLAITSESAQLTEDEIDKHFNSISYYTAQIESHPDRAISYFARAIDYMMVKNYPAAIADLNKAIGLSDKFTMAYFARANAKYCQMQAEAITETQNKADVAGANLLKEKLRQRSIIEINDDYDKVLQLSPQMVYALYNKGCLYLDIHDNTSAVSAFSKAIELRPDFGEAYYNRGLVYFRLGNKDNGVADLSKAGEYGITPSYSVIKKMAQ